jgi:raffinose/stachyose/melibiose transport system permease protein
MTRDPTQRGSTRGVGSPMMGFLFVLPAFGLFCLFGIWPVIRSFVLSLHEWPGIGGMSWRGLQNYVQAFGDPVVRLSFLNNAVYSIGIILFGVVPGLFLSILLVATMRGRLLFQTIFFFPRLVTQVIVALVWSWIYNPVFGLLNNFLRAVGLGSLALGWLGDPTWAMWAVIVAAGWTYFGFCMVIFMAALQNTDPFLYDAALIDGANGVQIFWNVTLPQIQHVLTMVIVFTLIDSFKVFDIIYLMTSGGPGDKTQIMATFIYREAFRHNHYGYSAAVSILLTVFILAVSVIILRLRERSAET